MSKISAVDASAMNYLYTRELARMGVRRTAASTSAEGDDRDLQAFKDHEEYQDLLEKVLSDDSKESFDPNNPILD